MSENAARYRSDSVRTVGVIGAGLIGGAWAAYFLSRGLSVKLFDAADGAAERGRALIADCLADRARLGPVAADAADRQIFCDTLEEAVAGSDYIQENVSEKIDLKRDLLRRIDAIAPADVLIGSSTSSFPASDLQIDCARPDRILVAHPFNPPHLVPLVEVGRGAKTSEDAQDAACRFFKLIGKEPIKIRKEAVGHVANRMSAALWREAVHIVAEGIASVDDVDRAIRCGPGLRWAVDGPHMLYHLGGGDGGLTHYLAHLGAAQEARWKTLGDPRLDAATCAKLIAGIEEEAAGRSLKDLKARRDDLLIALLRTLEGPQGADPAGVSAASTEA